MWEIQITLFKNIANIIWHLNDYLYNVMPNKNKSQKRYLLLLIQHNNTFVLNEINFHTPHLFLNWGHYWTYIKTTSQSFCHDHFTYTKVNKYVYKMRPSHFSCLIYSTCKCRQILANNTQADDKPMLQLQILPNNKTNNLVNWSRLCVTAYISGCPRKM